MNSSTTSIAACVLLIAISISDWIRVCSWWLFWCFYTENISSVDLNQQLKRSTTFSEDLVTYSSNRLWRLTSEQENILKNEYRSVSQSNKTDRYLKVLLWQGKRNVYLENGDIFRFNGNNWLLGENIDAFLSSTLRNLPNCADYYQISSCYFSMIAQEYHRDFHERMKFCPSVFRCFGSIDQLKLDIIIPIHRPQHWISALISYHRKTIFIKDSLFGNHEMIATILKKW